MGHRHTFRASQLSDMDSDRNWEDPHSDPRLHLENGPFVLPVENSSVGGVNTISYFNTSLRSNDLPSSNFSPEIPNFRAANTGTLHDSYMHPSSAGSSSRVPPNYAQHGPPYNQFTAGGGSEAGHPQMDYRRAALKRKAPAFSAAFDSGSSSRYYSVGSSSNLPAVSSAHLQPKPVSGPQCWPRDPINMVPSFGSNNHLTAGEGSQRNVRGRHSHALHLEMNPSGSHLSSNLPRHIPGRTVAGQWSYGHVSSDSHRTHSSGSIVTTSSTDSNGRYHHSNRSPNRNPCISMPTFHGPLTRSRSTYGQRTAPHSAIPSYRPMGFAATLDNGRQPSLHTTAPPRHSRPLSIGRSSERIGRARNIYDGFHSFSYGENTHNRWIPQGVAMVDRSSIFYDSSMFDQHRDLRLDIDNMGYEELLALEERIGNVSTGLPECTLLKCLTETICCLSDQPEDGEEGNCVICLEEYKDRETLGRLKCGHDFHASCIKNWLQIKNVCPICKASALEDPEE